MYGRSVLLLYRLSRTPSPLVNACFLGNHQRQSLLLPNQNQRFLAQKPIQPKQPSRFRRFLRWFGLGSAPVAPVVATPPEPPTTMQRVKRLLAISPPIERFFLRSHIIEDEDLARLISKTAAIAIYAIVGVTTLGTLGVDTKPLLAGIGITGFTIGFALKEVATNFISGIFLVINKPFVRGCRIKIHGSGGGIEGKTPFHCVQKRYVSICLRLGLVRYIDIRYVHLKTKDRKSSGCSAQCHSISISRRSCHDSISHRLHKSLHSFPCWWRSECRLHGYDETTHDWSDEARDTTSLTIGILAVIENRHSETGKIEDEFRNRTGRIIQKGPVQRETVNKQQKQCHTKIFDSFSRSTEHIRSYYIRATIENFHRDDFLQLHRWVFVCTIEGRIKRMQVSMEKYWSMRKRCLLCSLGFRENETIVTIEDGPFRCFGGIGLIEHRPRPS